MTPNDPVVVKCTIEAAEFEKIKDLAARMGHSPTRMASMLLQAGLEDNELTIKAVTFIVKKMRAAAETVTGKNRKPAR
jgi:hypothetical protein